MLSPVSRPNKRLNLGVVLGTLTSLLGRNLTEGGKEASDVTGSGTALGTGNVFREQQGHQNGWQKPECAIPNMPLWHKNYFELIILRNSRHRGRSENRGCTLRDTQTYKGSLHL